MLIEEIAKALAERIVRRWPRFQTRIWMGDSSQYYGINIYLSPNKEECLLPQPTDLRLWLCTICVYSNGLIILLPRMSTIYSPLDHQDSFTSVLMQLDKYLDAVNERGIRWVKLYSNDLWKVDNTVDYDNMPKSLARALQDNFWPGPVFPKVNRTS